MMHFAKRVLHVKESDYKRTLLDPSFVYNVGHALQWYALKYQKAWMSNLSVYDVRYSYLRREMNRLSCGDT